MSDERPESLAEQAAEWVPPWQRPDYVPPSARPASPASDTPPPSDSSAEADVAPPEASADADVAPELSAEADNSPELSADADVAREASADADAAPGSSADVDVAPGSSADVDVAPEQSADVDVAPEASAEPPTQEDGSDADGDAASAVASVREAAESADTRAGATTEVDAVVAGDAATGDEAAARAAESSGLPSSGVSTEDAARGSLASEADVAAPSGSAEPAPARDSAAVSVGVEAPNDQILKSYGSERAITHQDSRSDEAAGDAEGESASADAATAASKPAAPAASSAATDPAVADDASPSDEILESNGSDRAITHQDSQLNEVAGDGELGTEAAGAPTEPTSAQSAAGADGVATVDAAGSTDGAAAGTPGTVAAATEAADGAAAGAASGAKEKAPEHALALIDDAELRGALEAVLLVVDEPVSEIVLAQVLEQPTERIAAMLTRIAEDYTSAGHGFELRRAAGGWRLYTRPAYAPYVERFVLDGQSVRLTQAALETLAVVAYKQPVTRSRISAIRGVNCDGVIRTLVSRGLVEECGTEPETGAHLYRTTVLFLEKLGLNTVDELPPLAPFLPDDVDEFADAQ